jgi:hypothetical protein
MRRLVLTLTAAAVFGLLVVAPSAPAALPECPPDQPPESSCVITIDDHFVDDELCGFDVAIDAVGKILYTPRFDRTGELVAELFRPNIKVSLTGVESGLTATDRDVGLDKAVFLPDGSIEVLSTGLHFKVRAGGRDTIFRRIGLQIIHIDPNGVETVEVIGGNFQPEEDFPPILCGWLAGS